MIFFWIRKILKAIGWKGGLAIVIAGLIAFLWTGNQSLKAKIEALRWKLITAEAKIDTAWIDAEYSPPDTVWGDSILVPVPYPVHDTLAPDSIWLPFPRIKGSAYFNTTKYFGEDSSLSVQVEGKFFFPERLPDTNWLLIVPEFGKPPVMPPKQRARDLGIGITMGFSTQPRPFIGVQGRFKSMSVAVMRQIPENQYYLGIGYELRF